MPVVIVFGHNPQRRVDRSNSSPEYSIRIVAAASMVEGRAEPPSLRAVTRLDLDLYGLKLGGGTGIRACNYLGYDKSLVGRCFEIRQPPGRGESTVVPKVILLESRVLATKGILVRSVG